MGILLYSAVAYVFFVSSFLYAVGWMGNLPFFPTTIDGRPGTPVSEALLVDLGLLSIFALQHSVMARPGFKRIWTRIVPPPAERATYVLLSSGCLFAVCLFWRTLPGTAWKLEGVTAAIAWVGYALGWMLALASTFVVSHAELFGLRQAVQHLRGQRPEPPAFRERGLYRVVRHPLMLGFLVAFWSVPQMTSGRLFFALVTTAYILVALRFEERDMRDCFGEAYAAYRARVPMLIPRLFRRKAPVRISGA